MTKEDILKRLTLNFKKSKIEVNDMTGQNNHFSILVLSKKFEGISLIDRHKMIYSIFKKEIINEIHALQIQAFTLLEWKSKKN